MRCRYVQQFKTNDLRRAVLTRAGPCRLLQGAWRITKLKTAGDIRLGDHRSCGSYAKRSPFDITTREHR